MIGIWKDDWTEDDPLNLWFWEREYNMGEGRRMWRRGGYNWPRFMEVAAHMERFTEDQPLGTDGITIATSMRTVMAMAMLMSGGE